ncbi:MAG: sulfatase [Candidatus Puniceispirillales bacterium]
MTRPNIILICTDQMRFDALGCTGNQQAKTPHIDQLAAHGVTFSNHITPCQICAPSRASLFSGKMARRHGLTHNGMALAEDQPLLTHRLKQAGYRTHGIGKFHFQPILAGEEHAMPESNAFWQTSESRGWTGPFYGFDTAAFVIGESFASTRGGHYGRWLHENHPEVVDLYLPENSLDDDPDEMDEVWRSAVPPEYHYNTWIAGQAADFITATKTDEPFFMFVSFPDPHHPFSPPAAYADLFDPLEMPMPTCHEDELEKMPDYIGKQTWVEGADTKITYKEFLASGTFSIEQGTWQRTAEFGEMSMRKIIAYTHALNVMIDEGVGRIMAALETRGITEDTVVIFTSDHGELLGDHGLIRKGPMPYRQLLNIPLVIAGAQQSGGDEISALTSHLDLMPTILDLAGISTHEGEGKSLLPLIEGAVESLHEYAYGEYHPRTVRNQYNHTIMTAHERLTLYPLAEGKDWGEYFDHRDDPGEHHNRYHDPACQNRINALRQQLLTELPPAPKAGNKVLGIY